MSRRHDGFAVNLVLQSKVMYDIYEDEVQKKSLDSLYFNSWQFYNQIFLGYSSSNYL